jgi:hypothetical protein
MAKYFGAANNGLKYKLADQSRSGLEKAINEQLREAGVDFQYEKREFAYVTRHIYTPDYELPNGIIVEAKGYWLPEDRTKIETILKDNPCLDLRMVFSNSKTYLTSKKNRKTPPAKPKLKKDGTPAKVREPDTYGSWCAKRGIPYADKLIPPEWLAERKREKP